MEESTQKGIYRRPMLTARWFMEMTDCGLHGYEAL